MVKFVNARPYLHIPLQELNKLLVCTSGRREVVVLCDDEKLRETLRNLPSDYFIPRMSDIQKYLKDNNIPYEVGDLKNTTIL